MTQPQRFNYKICVTDKDGNRERAKNSVFVKDLPITDIRWNLEYLNKVRDMSLLKFTGDILKGIISIEDVLSRVTFTIFMSYSEADVLCTTPHPLHNIIMKKRNYLEGPKPGTLTKISDPSLPSYDWDQYGIHISTDETLKDLNTVKVLKWLWFNHRLNYDAWMKMIMVMGVAQRRMRVGPNKNYLIDECVSTKVSVNALIGPRGLCHGLWNLEVPKLRIDPNTDSYDWPSGWALHFDTDDNSSFHMSSPENSDFDTDSVDSGPIGVACDRPRITGFTSFTETSSESTNEISREAKFSRLDVFVDGHSGDYWDRRMRKRFDLYIKSSSNERRNRRAIREARRLVRIQYNVNHRKLEPAFDSEAKRAEALAAERVRAEIRDCINKKRKNINHKPIEKPLEYYLYRYRQFNHNIRSQLECAWKRYYGENIISQYMRQSVNQQVKDIEGHNISLKCWISPVLWIDQPGINSGGFSAIYMVVRQLRLIEVILGDVNGKHSAQPRDLLRQFPNGAKFIDNQKAYFDVLGVDNSLDWNKIMVSSLITRIKECGFTNWGEMFSAEILTAVAKTYMSDRFTISLVKRDILANYTNYFNLKALEDNENAVHEKGDTIKKKDPSWSMSIVQHLVRGHLIIVCYDADEKMRPTFNGGRTAHWTLLCGVIVGFPYKQQSSEKTDGHPKMPNSEKLKYVYEYEPNTYLLTPMGQYICRETGEPVTNETIKERAKIEAEELKDDRGRDDGGGDKHSQACHRGRYKCQKCTIEYVDTKMDLERDADSVWVVARERGEYQVWSLRELANSNRQLRKAGRDILNTVPRQVKDNWIMESIDGRGGDHKVRSPTLRAAVSTFKQRKTVVQNAERRKNRAVCTSLTDQMVSLSRAHPLLAPSELVEMLDLSMCSGNLKEVWKSAVKVAFEAPVRFPQTELMQPERPATTEAPIHQMPEAPPPLPIPTSPTPVTPPMNTSLPSRSCPYVLPDGPRLDLCLARQYICIELADPLYKNDGMDFIPDVNNLNDVLTRSIQYFYSIEGKLRVKKGPQAGWIVERNTSKKKTKFTE